MSITLSSMRTAVRVVCSSLLRFSSPFSMCCTRLIEPRLHTAISSADVFSVISVHRLDECDYASMLLGRTHVAGVFEGDPRMPLSQTT